MWYEIYYHRRIDLFSCENAKAQAWEQRTVVVYLPGDEDEDLMWSDIEDDFGPDWVRVGRRPFDWDDI